MGTFYEMDGGPHSAGGEIVAEWEEYYYPKHQILEDLYEKILGPIRTEEVMDSIRGKSNGKAPKKELNFW